MSKHPPRWPVLRSSRQFDCRVFALRKDTSVSPRTGNDHDFFILECGNWVNVIPVTPDGEVIMVRQYRHGIRAVTLEIPGGLIDGEDTDPTEAARRELLEETGFVPGRIFPIGVVHAQPALQDNYCHTCLALDCVPMAEPSPDAGEDLRVALFPLEEVPRRIAEGEITHGLVLAAFYWYELWKQGPGRDQRGP